MNGTAGGAERCRTHQLYRLFGPHQFGNARCKTHKNGSDTSQACRCFSCLAAFFDHDVDTFHPSRLQVGYAALARQLRKVLGQKEDVALQRAQFLPFLEMWGDFGKADAASDIFATIVLHPAVSVVVAPNSKAPTCPWPLTEEFCPT